jgi:hypothetical protein
MAVLNFISASFKHVESADVAPDANAFCQHLAFAATFLTAALFFAMAHFPAGVVPAWMTPALTTRSTVLATNARRAERQSDFVSDMGGSTSERGESPTSSRPVKRNHRLLAWWSP